MTDKQWQRVIDKCQEAGQEHLRLLRIAEAEYEKRYGHNPSEVDDDWWIDTVHYCKGNTDIELIKMAANDRNDRR